MPVGRHKIRNNSSIKRNRTTDITSTIFSSENIYTYCFFSNSSNTITIIARTRGSLIICLGCGAGSRFFLFWLLVVLYRLVLIVILNSPSLYEVCTSITIKKIITKACAVMISRVGRLSHESCLPLRFITYKTGLLGHESSLRTYY